MEMNRANKQNERGKEREMGSGHGKGRMQAGKQKGPQNKATAGGHSRRILRPAQASKQQRPAIGRPRSKHNSRRQSWPASRRAVQVDGGSAVVLAARKAGSDLLNLFLPHLSPLPVTVPTHSLNLQYPI